jgi:thiol:disulfide interchange protein
MLVATATGVLLLAFPVIFYWRVEPPNAAFRAAGIAGTVPKDWAAWRTRWETGHALRFVLHLLALVLLASAATQVGSPSGPEGRKEGTTGRT